MSNVIKLEFTNPVESAMSAVKALEPNDVILIGYDKDDGFFFHSTMSDGGDVLWLMEIARTKLMEVLS